MNKIDMNLAAMDLNLIVALNALLDHQSVSRAADDVGRTQSAMSHSLSRLRRHFRDPILVRDGWEMQLTPFAKDLRPRVAAAAQAARLVFATKTGFDPATTTRRIRIAAPDLCASLFTRFIGVLSQQAPHASVVFIEAANARQAVLKSEADVGLGFGVPKPDPNLMPVQISPLEWCTFAPAAHHYAASSTVQTWAAARHIVVGQSGTNKGPVEKALRRRGLTRHVVCYASNFSAALGLAAETNALFSTLRTPFEGTAERLGMQACPIPFDMPPAPAALMFRTDYGDPFSIWLRQICVDVLR